MEAVCKGKDHRDRGRGEGAVGEGPRGRGPGGGAAGEGPWGRSHAKESFYY